METARECSQVCAAVSFVRAPSAGTPAGRVRARGPGLTVTVCASPSRPRAVRLDRPSSSARQSPVRTAPVHALTRNLQVAL